MSSEVSAEGALFPTHSNAPLDVPLFTPFQTRGLTLRNRVVVSPMQMYSVQEGVVGDWHLVHLGRFALGGAGLVVVEATAISPEGRSTLQDNGLWNDVQADAFRRITDFLRANGAASAIQLQHAGRKASSQAPWHGFGPLSDADALRGEHPWQPWGPTSHGWSDQYPPTRPIGEPEMAHLIDRYRNAATLAVRAGFDAIEIHAAHGYLLHSFLSPLANTRDDDYGGDLERRMRFPLRVVAAVREAWPDERPLLFRMSAVDGIDVGWTLDDSVELARRLRGAGVDVVDCSSGGMKLPSTSSLVPRTPGFQVPFAREVRRRAGVATMSVGLIRTPAQANAIIADGDADLVALAREHLWNPNWAAQAAVELGGDAQWKLWPRAFGWWLRRREGRHTVRAPASTR
ncbi:MAG: NADH:flavin oxidoreductase/NADH oxidase [Pseudomonadota bacterium]|nr:NADH:flavin oxidoreductase/NADH oxidase [Pseudomonadota bacterium]